MQTEVPLLQSHAARRRHQIEGKPIPPPPKFSNGDSGHLDGPRRGRTAGLLCATCAL